LYLENKFFAAIFIEHVLYCHVN